MLVYRLLKSLPARWVLQKPPTLVDSWITFNQCYRGFADTPRRDASRHVMLHGPNDDIRVRVRRARAEDAPRVIRFVKKNTSLAWPGLVNASNMPSQIVLSDYVARTLAQGHTLLAEQQVEKRGWSEIRGLALSTAVCSWDALMLEKWARCVQCPKSRKLMLLTAHCLRAPALHDKYRVHNILQVVLLVPADTPKCTEVVQILARNSIQRGRELGFPLIRFDVTEDIVARALEAMKLKKEYEFSYEVLPNVIKIYTADTNKEGDNTLNGKLITVYTSFPLADAEN